MIKITKSANKQISNGFTLVELLLYIALLSLLMGILVTFFVSILKFQLTTQETSAETQDIRFILSRLSWDMGGVDSVLVPGSLGQSTPILQLVKEGVTYTYSLDGDNNLILTAGASSDKLNGLDTKISSLNFRRLGFIGGTPAVQVIFTVGDQTVQTTYGLR